MNAGAGRGAVAVVVASRARPTSPTAQAEYQADADRDRRNDRAGPALSPVAGTRIVDHPRLDVAGCARVNIGGRLGDFILERQLDNHDNVLR
jgi:hypothetical protein